MINNTIIYKFFEDFTNHRKSLTREQFVVVDLSPTSLNTETTDKTFQQFGKQDSLRHMFNSPASIQKVQAHNSLESPREYTQDQIPLMSQGLL